jgi:hypothetical protein
LRRRAGVLQRPSLEDHHDERGDLDLLDPDLPRARGVRGADRWRLRQGRRQEARRGRRGGKGLSARRRWRPGGLSRALSIMPADSEIVIALDFKQIRASDLWKKYEGLVMGQVGKGLEEFKTVCGWDPIAKASGALAAGRGKQMDEMTVFVKGFDKASVLDCLKKAADKAKAENEGRAMVIDGDYVELTKPGGDPIRFMFADDDTILIQRVPGNDAMADKAALQAVLAAKDGDGLMSSATFSSLIDATDTTRGACGS